MIGTLIDAAELKRRIGLVLPMAEASRARELLEDIRKPVPTGNRVIGVASR